MLCDKCQKNEATIHLKEVVDDDVVAVNLCAECAAGSEVSDLDVGGGLNLAKMLVSLTAEVMPNLKVQSAKAQLLKSGDEEMVCAFCGISTNEIRQTGRLGCPSCYKMFSGMLAPALKNMHRGDHHKGRQPNRVESQSGAVVTNERARLAQLEEELARAVALEEYERAAELRDQIQKRSESSRQEG